MCHAWEVQFEQFLKRIAAEVALLGKHLRFSYDLHCSGDNEVAKPFQSVLIPGRTSRLYIPERLEETGLFWLIRHDHYIACDDNLSEWCNYRDGITWPGHGHQN